MDLSKVGLLLHTQYIQFKRQPQHFSVILRPCVLIRPRESNPRLPALLSNALPTELTLPLNSGLYIRCKETSSLLFHHAKFVKCLRIFRELSSKGLYLSFKKKRKENRCLVFTISMKREIKKFYVVVVQ